MIPKKYDKLFGLVLLVLLFFFIYLILRIKPAYDDGLPYLRPLWN